jgi:nucleotide-binding universal stress UspA family protein
MMKTIFASLTGLGSDRTVLDAAIAAARIDGAHVLCLHTRIDPVETTMLYKSMTPRHVELMSEISRKIAVEEKGRSEHAKAAFQDACKRHALSVCDAPPGESGVSISWKEVETLLNETLHEARYHDLVVMARDAELSSERVKSVLMQSGRPILIAPQKPVDVVGRNVAIAWKAGAEAARALSAASSLLSRAEQIAIIAVSEGDAEDDGESADYLAGQLRWRGVKVEVHREPSGTSPASRKILDIAYKCDADMLVMGAYGHSRVREFVFGGVTQDILSDCALPVLMFH